MSGIRPTSGSTPPTPVDTGRSSSAATVTPVSAANPSGGQSNPAVPQASSVSSLSEGAMLAAIVTARATGGDTMLHTEVGNFRMASRSPIPVGSHVVLEVEALDDVITARVIAINGEKLASPPAVTLLPVVQAGPNKPDLYAMAAKLTSSEGTDGRLQNITAALTPTAKASTQATVNTLTGQGPPAPPSGATASTSGPPNPNSVLAAALSAGMEGRAASTSASRTAAAYAHTTAPGPRADTPASAAAGNTAQTTGTTGNQVTGAPTQTANELVRATIDTPAFNQRLVRAAGLADTSIGSKLTLVVSSAAAPATLTPELTKNIATGTVISLSGPMGAAGAGKKQVHIQSPELGTLRYTTNNPPTPGTQVSLSLTDKLALFPLMPMDTTSGAIKIPHMSLLSDWENLRAALNLLAAQDPAIASMLLGSRIPSANANLGASLLFFLSALNGGGLTKWFGSDFTQAMEKGGHGDLFKALNDDFATLSRLNSDPAGNDWKALVFPFFAEDRLHQLRMFYRKHGRNGENGVEDETRFLIELDLSKSGPVQLDGLFRPKHFDLVFRHQQELDLDLKNQVIGIFQGNMEITGMVGGLTFRKTTPFPIHPTEEWEARIPNRQDA